MNPLDGDYKFEHCIFRAKEQMMMEIAGCGGCGMNTRKFDQGFKCKKRNILLNETNRKIICGTCWVGEEEIDGQNKLFPQPWERK